MECRRSAGRIGNFLGAGRQGDAIRKAGHQQEIKGTPIAFLTVTRYIVTRYSEEMCMAIAADRMKAMRERRRARGLRELRLVVPDPRSKAVRRRVAKEVAALNAAHERAALKWIEAVSEFDAG
jgi:hypothetical protein